MPLNFQTRVLIFANKEELVYFRPLKDFLFKIGLRDTTFISDPRAISGFIFDNFWPIIIVDHVDGHTDGMAVFDGLYKTLGYELLPFIFLAPAENAVYQQFSMSLGARGVIKKPLQPSEAQKILKSIIPAPSDPATAYAMVIAKLMLNGELSKAAAALPKLLATQSFKRGAEIALARCEVKTGKASLAFEKFQHLLEKEPNNIRYLCELAEYHKSNSQFINAIELYDRIHNLHPSMNVKIWDQIVMLIELDHLDPACDLLDSLLGNPTFRDLATEGMTHIMNFLGMGLGIPGVLKSQPELLKRFLANSGNQLNTKG